MFCPKCRAEYIDGVTACDDCKIPLVSILPPATEEEPAPGLVDYQEVLMTNNAGDIALIKSILDGTSIAFYFLGETPLIHPARLMVKKGQVQDVKELLKDTKFTNAEVFTEKTEE